MARIVIKQRPARDGVSVYDPRNPPELVRYRCRTCGSEGRIRIPGGAAAFAQYAQTQFTCHGDHFDPRSMANCWEVI